MSNKTWNGHIEMRWCQKKNTHYKNTNINNKMKRFETENSIFIWNKYCEDK